ncbi:hypothetical protein A2X44_02585 [candidate division CPR3 bacterium GWF2_35_18]|uniref:Uncharacterized protein n=1 Tax=candidate division CPR3 bacterium GW2011_GWF2_35_18 TaxID=1618350 RepID=A0A0G0BZG6_UNCC3|nr:MAG: hypothetical protein UR67_C0008G0007 [candidate division CPR3 bacterium GW2011_GWF2_35_18]KKP85582.1 MAG: hypothetical protein UR87_C0044G0009 [candidate division CPR3 bacterium GW2011_GWE2_35_7]OGB62479.1 MAG: hypothetical protein A2X44_02585 [candidate division CPR3 bacterium GWF2_35_18]
MIMAVKNTTRNQEAPSKRLMIALNIIKVIVVLILAGTITYLSDNFHNFEMVDKDVEYGIWHGFPLSFYFEGYHINWGNYPETPIADWVNIRRYNYVNMAIDFIIYAIFIGGILYLIEKGLKKLLKITW